MVGAVVSDASTPEFTVVVAVVSSSVGIRTQPGLLRDRLGLGVPTIGRYELHQHGASEDEQPAQ